MSREARSPAGSVPVTPNKIPPKASSPCGIIIVTLRSG